MPSAKEVLLASLLGGIQGGTSGYSGEQKNQREYALKKLEAEKPPSDIQSLMFVEPNFPNLTDQEKRQRYLDSKTAGAGVSVRVGNEGSISKTPLTGQQPTSTQEYKSAKNRVTAAEAAGKKPNPADVGIVTKYEQGTQKSGGGW